MRHCIACAFVLVTFLAACREVTVPNYNAPDADQLVETPTASTVSMATVGLLIQLRARAAGTATTLGIFGKESYLLTPAEPQSVSALLGGPMQPGGFGENVGWSDCYLAVRQGSLILTALDKLAMPEAQKEGTRGFVKTLMAMELFTQVLIRDQVGIVLGVSDSPEPAPIATKNDALLYISRLLDSARTHLEYPQASFVFPLHTGFSAFNTPATFVRFNRAIKARVEVHREQWSSALTALAQSFVDTSAGTATVLRRGAYHVYSAADGDARNGMLNPALYVHPSILSGAQTRANGQPDLRLSQKTAAKAPTTVAGVQGTHGFIIYPTNTTDVPILRNEELILLRAEARYHTGDAVGALGDINFVRVNSGGLPPRAGFATAQAFVDELLYNRAYSLLFEGHRWVDARRYGRLAQLPKLNTVVNEKTWPYIMLPQRECELRNPKPQLGCAAVPGI